MGTTSIAAGWYKDPGGSDALRWWDGNQWTANLQHPTPAAPSAPVVATVPFSQTPVIAAPVFTPAAPAGYGQQIQEAPPAEPEINLSAYSPGRGYSDTPRDPNYDSYTGSAIGSPGYYGNSRLMQSSNANNTVAWLSLIAGVLAIGAIFVRLALPSGSFYLPVFGLTAIISGIRALVRYRSRRVTVLWAPIVGILLGLTAEILLFSAIILPINATTTNGLTGTTNGSTGPTKEVPIGPTGTFTVHDMGTGQPNYQPASNGELQTATMALQNMVTQLKNDYAPSINGAEATSGVWPSQLSRDAAGNVRASDGRNFGQVLKDGEHIAYALQPDGSYILGISGTDLNEVVAYSSKSNEYTAICEASDDSCNTASPIAPRTGTDDGSTGSSTTS